jgi:catechol 2,3-dioxygenase-like lactoylglutathione lyase family enzyme
MLDHVFLSVSSLERSIAFYTAVLKPLGIVNRVDYDGADGPPGHPDLKGFGCDGRIFFWLREGVVEGRAAHVGFVARSAALVDAAYAAAMVAGATDNGAPGVRAYYDPRYYAAGVLDPDGYSLEFVHKEWQL